MNKIINKDYSSVDKPYSLIVKVYICRIYLSTYI